MGHPLRGTGPVLAETRRTIQPDLAEEAESSDDCCAGKQAKRSWSVAPGRTCNVTALLLCLPAPLLSASMRTAVTPGGTTYSWTTSHSIATIDPLLLFIHRAPLRVT
jgi:hypothetical protein